MPSIKTVSQIQAALLHPATTSHYYLEIQKPEGIDQKYWSSNGIDINTVNLDKLNLMCSEATLPGSNFATLELTNDHTGVTERHAYRRVYDDRIDFTFYVDAENYLPIRFFEVWMKYIAQESVSTPKDNSKVSSVNQNYFYRFNYSDNYVARQGTKITKFERSTYGITSKGDSKERGRTLTYEFIRAFPISISSMPISYDTSSLLKCTVSMSYIRYIVSTPDPTLEQDKGERGQTPQQQASLNSYFNGAPDYFLNPQFGSSALPELSKSDVTSQIRAAELENSLGSSDASRAFLDSFNKTNSREVGRIGP